MFSQLILRKCPQILASHIDNGNLLARDVIQKCESDRLWLAVEAHTKLLQGNDYTYESYLTGK